MKVIFNNVRKFMGLLKTYQISEYTSQCAYYTILSFIPFLMLIVTLIQYTGISKEFLLSVIQSFMPATMSDATVGIVQEVYSKSVGTISISAVFVLWSAGKGFFALSKGLHNIYDTDKNYNVFYILMKSLICTVFLVCLIIMVLTVSVFGDTILSYVQLKFGISERVINVFNFSKIGIYFILFVILLLMYKFIPGHKFSLKTQIPGAIIGTFGWYLVSFFFSLYIDMFKGFSIMYGSLTTIVLSMMWVYFCMYIILIGAVINVQIGCGNNSKIICNSIK